MTLVSAEIEPQPGKGRAAAAALQELGFRVLHLGETISVDGPETLWHSVFAVRFESLPKSQGPSMPSQDTYLHALDDTLRIPADLADLLANVYFAEPPELFSW